MDRWIVLISLILISLFLELHILAGLELHILAGLELNIPAGLELHVPAGLELHVLAGLKLPRFFLFLLSLQYHTRNGKSRFL